MDTTFVLAIYNKLDIFKSFLEHNQIDAPLVVSCLGSDDETQDYVEMLEDATHEKVKAVTGYRNSTRRITFSENWNAAINAVETEKMVLIHNDFVLGPNFGEIISKALDEEGKGTFVTYTTVEPTTYLGHIRPGKLIGGFGTTFENFQYEEFNAFCKKVQVEKKDFPRLPGYGFFLAGWTEDFKQVGGFDFETFVPCFCEDDDLSIRNKMKGFRTVVDPRALAFHFVSLTSRGIQRTPTASEVNTNRRFARKWGFEARYLWETGYEYSDKPLDLWNWKTSLRIGEFNSWEHCRDIVLQLEPLVDTVILPEKAFKDPVIQSYLQSESLRAGLDIRTRFEVEEGQHKADIEFFILGEPDFKVLPRFIGGIRFTSKLKKGEYEPYPWLKVVVHNPICLEKREDTKNYLFLQENNNDTF